MQPDDPGEPIQHHLGYGNVSNGDGREVKNWLLGLFAAILTLAAGGITMSVIQMEGRMARVEAKMDTIIACLQGGK
jgi:hypothetical protein